jgi:hypothetical protein
MKKYILLITFLSGISFLGYSQAIPFVGKKVRTLETIKIQGSPYQDKMFARAKIGKIDQAIFIRYNVFKDEFEYITPKNDSLILDKIEDFGEIVFANTNKKYKLTTYINSENKLFYGYLVELYTKNKTLLYKKYNVSFTDEKLAKTTLEQDKPAKYNTSSPFYFIKYDDKIPTEFPTNKKGLLKLFPEKKEAIETFLKENKINFSDENDLKKVVDLIARF